MDYVRIHGTVGASGFITGWWSTPPIEIVRAAEANPDSAWLAVALGIGLSLLAATMPIYRVARLRVTDALRRIE